MWDKLIKENKQNKPSHSEFKGLVLEDMRVVGAKMKQLNEMVITSNEK